MGVGHFSGANLVSLLVLFAPEVILHDRASEEVATARHAIVLATACFILVNRLI